MKQQRIYIDTSKNAIFHTHVIVGLTKEVFRNTLMEKKIDCVKMKNDIQARIYEKIKEMTVEEMLLFFNSPKNKVLFGK